MEFKMVTVLYFFNYQSYLKEDKFRVRRRAKHIRQIFLAAGDVPLGCLSSIFCAGKMNVEDMLWNYNYLHNILKCSIYFKKCFHKNSNPAKMWVWDQIQCCAKKKKIKKNNSERLGSHDLGVASLPENVKS